MTEKQWELGEIPREVFEGDETVLKKRVVHFRKGARRIFVFTIVGLIMGWFSYLYVGITFFPLKAVIAVPYKINEIIHNLFHGTHVMQTEINTFFPSAALVSDFTEFVLPMFFGAAIYGSLAYFTGDRKVFTYKRYLKFAAVWAAILAMLIGATFAVNAAVEKKNESLENVTGFFVSNEMRGQSYMVGEADEFDQMIGRYLKRAFYEESERLSTAKGVKREKEKEQALGLWFTTFGESYMECSVNLEQEYLVTKGGQMYKLSEAFVNMLKKYDLYEGYNSYFEQFEKGEKISYEEMAD